MREKGEKSHFLYLFEKIMLKSCRDIFESKAFISIKCETPERQ